MSHVTRIAHDRLLSALEPWGLVGLFPRYVCHKIPAGASWGVVDAQGQVQACLVGGVPWGMFQVWSDWLLARNAEAAQLLLPIWGEEVAARKQGGALSFDLRFRDVIAAHTDWTVTVDQLLLATKTTFRPAPPPKAQFLTAEWVDTAVIPDELKQFLVAEDIHQGMRFAGAFDGEMLCAIAEACVDDGTAASIQQVMTRTPYRQLGHGKRVVSLLCETLLSEGKQVTYIADEANVASIKLAVSLGFELHSRIGCAALSAD